MKLELNIIDLRENKSTTVKIDEYYLVYGTDKSMYDTPQWHVAEYSDLDDGFDGDFKWYTETGIVIENVTHVSDAPLKSPTFI